MIQGGDHLKYPIQGLCTAVDTLVHKHGLIVLLCIGDRPIRDYLRLREAGASQAIVKFETSNERVYAALRPHSKLLDRLRLIENLHEMGYQVSSGFIHGLPGTDNEDMEQDLKLVNSLPLFAASVSPFIPNDQSPLKGGKPASLVSTLECIAQLRLNNPKLLIPSVSALNLVASFEGRKEKGQLLGLQAGANVLTVNFTPVIQRSSYLIYTTRRSVVQLQDALDLAKRAGLTISLDEPWGAWNQAISMRSGKGVGILGTPYLIS